MRLVPLWAMSPAALLLKGYEKHACNAKVRCSVVSQEERCAWSLKYQKLIRAYFILPSHVEAQDTTYAG